MAEAEPQLQAGVKQGGRGDFYSIPFSLALFRHSHLGKELKLLHLLLSAWTPKPPWSVIGKVGWWWPALNTDICISLAEISPLLECYISEWTAGHFYLKKCTYMWSSLQCSLHKSHSESGQKRCVFWFFSLLFPEQKVHSKSSLSPCLSHSLSPPLSVSLSNFDCFLYTSISWQACLLLLATGPVYIGDYNGVSVPAVVVKLP